MEFRNNNHEFRERDEDGGESNLTNTRNNHEEGNGGDSSSSNDTVSALRSDIDNNTNNSNNNNIPFRNTSDIALLFQPTSASTASRRNLRGGSHEWLNGDFQQLQQAWGANSAMSFGEVSSVFPSLHPLRLSTATQSLGASSLINRSDRSLSLVDVAHATTLERSLTTTAVVSAGPKSDVRGISSIIHDAARITDWNRVLMLCETNPECASYAGRDGWTALHHACNRRCPRPEVAEALIKAYPAALLQEEEKGWLPLHYACRFKAPKSVVNHLLNLYPLSGRASVAKRDRQGRTPLYYAVRYDAPPGVVGLLLQVDPSVVLAEDQNDESPLALVWDSWAEKQEGKRVIHTFLPGGFPEPEETTLEQRAVLLHERLRKERNLRKRWNKVNMLLKAAFGFPVEEGDEDGDDESLDSTKNNDEADHRVWRIVHATAAVKCHQYLFLLACALHPEQAKEHDENDLRRPGDTEISPESADSKKAHQTALHLAASSNAGGEAGKTVLITLLSLYPEAAEEQDGINGSLPLHRMVENPYKQDWPNHAGILYHFYPRAVQIQDHQGKLPLHRAAAAIKHVDRSTDEEERSVIVQLVRAYRQAALQADKSGCLPFHYIASHAEVWDDEVESVFSVNRNAVQSRAGTENYNRLPIHLAAANSLSKESLIQKLIHYHPRGSSMPDSCGKLPLHLSCEMGKEWVAGGVRSIYDAYPAAIRQPETNERGWLPLHMAAACPTSKVELLEKLVELYPDAAFHDDHKGRFPLHLACGAGKSWDEGLQLLFETNASALSSLDHFKQMPFHIAALRYCKKHDNDSSEVKIDIKPTPVVEAQKEKQIDSEEAAELDILYQLLRSDPSTILSLA